MHAALPDAASREPARGINTRPGASARPADQLSIRRALRNSRQAERDLRLSVHLPFCANACYFCNQCRVITKDRSKAADYLQLIATELAMLGRQLSPRQQLRQLHLGGSPTFFGHQALKQLMSVLNRHVNLDQLPAIDASVAIDPREVDWATLDLLRGLGFNRLNIMQPSLDVRVQRAINRLQGDNQLADCMTAARTLRFHSIGIELMCGLPEQTLDSFITSLDELLAWRPERLSLRCYAHQPERFPIQRHIQRSQLPDASSIALAETHFVQTLTRAGYQRVTDTLFILSQDPLALAIGDQSPTAVMQYTGTASDCDSLGIGPGAANQVSGLIWHNLPQLASWQERITHAQFAADTQQPVSTAQGLAFG